MVNSSVPAAFLSYAHVDDEHDRGSITEFRKALEGEVRVQTGHRDIRIFQDRDDIAWGQEWKVRIDSSLDAVTFLVPVLTPSFFASAQCRRELQRFVGRERRLGRRDLILPVYWIWAAPLENPARYAQDDLAQELAARQYTDWRELRFQQLTDPNARRALAGLATHFRDALDQVGRPDRSAVAIRANVTRAIHRTLDEVRTANPDAVGLVNLLVDAIRDSGRLPEPNARTLRWVCQSRLDQPPGALRESTAEPLGPDPDVDPAHADTFRTVTIVVIDAAVEAAVSAAGDSSVAAALLGALQEISARTGPAVTDGPVSALTAVRQEVDARLGVLRTAVEQAEGDAAQTRQRVAAGAADPDHAHRATAAEEATRAAQGQRDAAARELQAAKTDLGGHAGALQAHSGDRQHAVSMDQVFLGLLRGGPCRGYELKGLYDSQFPGARPLTFGQVYATLRRLEGDSLVEVLETRKDGEPEHTVYALTTLGEGALREWLATPEPPAMYGGAELVRKALTAIRLGENAIGYLNQQRGAHLKRMRELVQGAEPSGSPSASEDTDINVASLSADYAVAHLDADLRWLETAMARATHAEPGATQTEERGQ